MATDDILKAVAHFEDVARNNPLDHNAHHNLAHAYERANRIEASVQVKCYIWCA